MLEYLHLKNVGPAPELELDLAPRLNLLTGDNGLGKSFLLDIAWWALTRRWPAEVNPALTTGRMARPTGSRPASIEFQFEAKVTRERYESTFDRSQQAWTGRAGRPANPGLVLYAQVDGSFAVWDPARNYWRKRGNVDVQDRPPAYVFAPREIWDGLQGEQGTLCNGLINDWAGWQKERGAAFQQLKKVLVALSPDAQETLAPGELTRISLDDVRDMPTLRMPYGQEVPVVHASAGMRRIIALAYLLVWSWQEHLRASQLLAQATTKQVIFLIDEIEAHLHPRWQRTITRALLEAVRELSPQAGVQLIAATHSPLVMASVEPWFDAEQDAWFDLDLVRTNGGTAVQLQQRPFVRRGDVSSWLTSSAFDLGSARSEEAERAIEKARSLLASNTTPSAAAVREADEDLRKVLSDIDPFWVRWSAFAEPYRGAA
jgi:hypothetical protein